MKDILFIVNPVAGRELVEKKIKEIEEYYKGKDIDYRIVKTTRPKEATNLAREYGDIYRKIVAVGGDGTVNEVARGLYYCENPILGILPCGTGNDLARSLGIEEDFQKALDIVSGERLTQLDSLSLNGELFFNVGSIGLDGEVIYRHNKLKRWVKGKLSYVLSTLYTICAYRRKRCQLIVDNQEEEVDLVLLSLGNGNYYGGGYKMIPEARLGDGYIYYTRIKDISKLKMLGLVGKAKKGQHGKYKEYVKMSRGKVIELRGEDDFYINIDGELLPVSSQARLEILDKKIPVLY